MLQENIWFVMGACGHMGKIRIALIAGGWSKERDISLIGGNAAYKALDKKKK